MKSPIRRRGLRPAPGWIPGNRLRLLENGEEFFPAAFDAIAQARHEILLETFILFEDKVGLQLRGHLVEAARRGVQVDVTVDGYGSPGFSTAFLESLLDAGIRLHVFDPKRPLLGVRLNVFRRMHRKLLVVDGRCAFVGGINYSADHLEDFGPEAKQDYSVEIVGPAVREIRDFAAAMVERGGAPPAGESAPCGEAEALFAIRDNAHCRDDIERHYRAAIRRARQRIVIANAYFFPGHRLLRELRLAARRGVEVILILQGEPDVPMARFAARYLYDHLMRAGVQVYEYCARPFHGKVAVVDEAWATVGSSNLDPLSLSLNLEANVFVLDRDFNRQLAQRLLALREGHCQRVETHHARARGWLHRLTAPLVFHVLRHFPAWAGLLPAHTPETIVLSRGRGGSTSVDP